MHSISILVALLSASSIVAADHVHSYEHSGLGYEANHEGASDSWHDFYRYNLGEVWRRFASARSAQPSAQQSKEVKPVAEKVQQAGSHDRQQLGQEVFQDNRPAYTPHFRPDLESFDALPAHGTTKNNSPTSKNNAFPKNNQNHKGGKPSSRKSSHRGGGHGASQIRKPGGHQSAGTKFSKSSQSDRPNSNKGGSNKADLSYSQNYPTTHSSTYEDAGFSHQGSLVARGDAPKPAPSQPGQPPKDNKQNTVIVAEKSKTVTNTQPGNNDKKPDVKKEVKTVKQTVTVIKSAQDQKKDQEKAKEKAKLKEKKKKEEEKLKKKIKEALKEKDKAKQAKLKAQIKAKLESKKAAAKKAEKKAQVWVNKEHELEKDSHDLAEDLDLLGRDLHSYYVPRDAKPEPRGKGKGKGHRKPHRKSKSINKSQTDTVDNSYDDSEDEGYYSDNYSDASYHYDNDDYYQGYKRDAKLTFMNQRRHPHRKHEETKREAEAEPRGKGKGKGHRKPHRKNKVSNKSQSDTNGNSYDYHEDEGYYDYSDEYYQENSEDYNPSSNSIYQRDARNLAYPTKSGGKQPKFVNRDAEAEPRGKGKGKGKGHRKPHRKMRVNNKSKSETSDTTDTSADTSTDTSNDNSSPDYQDDESYYSDTNDNADYYGDEYYQSYKREADAKDGRVPHFKGNKKPHRKMKVNNKSSSKSEASDSTDTSYEQYPEVGDEIYSDNSYYNDDGYYGEYSW